MKLKDKRKIICESAEKYLLSYKISDDENLEYLNYGDKLVLSINRNRIIEFCEDLRNIKISDSVTSIGKYAFSRCNSLTDIDLDIK